MKAVVTGAAGFIGSHLVDRLLCDGWTVTGVDSFTDYYSRSIKRRNLQPLLSQSAFMFMEADLLRMQLSDLGSSFDVVFHQAGQPGVRASWRNGFTAYSRQNIEVTQRLLEWSLTTGIGRFVYASSSSVYGESGSAPLNESQVPRPHSPYGVSKLAAEHLVDVYRKNFGLASVSLRYFTVFGPRQRPDMAFTRLLVASLGGPAVPIFGDGEQSRDFTYVGDVVQANLVAASSDAPIGTYNIAGGGKASVNEILQLIQDITGHPPRIERAPAVPGDVRVTSGDTSAARDRLMWTPEHSLREGLEKQWEWLLGLTPEDLVEYWQRD